MESKEQIEELCERIKTMRGIFQFENRLNTSGGCKTAVSAKMRIGWRKIRDCGKLLLGRMLLMRMKGKVYLSCVG